MARLGRTFFLRFWRRALAAIAILLFCLQTSSFAFADDLGDLLQPPHIVVEMSNGNILSEHRMDQRWAPASLTKMMTAYTVFRAIELGHLGMDSPVRISEEAIIQPPTKMGFPIGTILTIETALKIILVKSANDISVALAQGAAGSEEAFIALMNAHARRLGMVDTQFRNPHGLHDPDQHTSARDMALLVRAISSEFEKYDGFFDIPFIRITNRRLRNHNALLRLFEGTNGMKTGYVCASGFNVAVKTKRGNREILAIVFGGRSGLKRNVRAAQLLTEAFESGGASGSPIGNLDMERRIEMGGFPDDITRVMCPSKYAATGNPVPRPQEAPDPEDFDPIDTQIAVQESEEEKQGSDVLAIPLKRPAIPLREPNTSNADQPTGASAIPASDEGADLPENTQPTLAELADIYLRPVANPGREQKLALGGATGPNPFGIKHTNGGRYVAPTPVPKPSPALDLKKPQE